MEHQEMIEVLEKEIEIARLSERVCQASPKRVKALTQVIALAKRVADVEGVMEISHSACEKCHAFSDRRLCGVKKGVCADSAAEISQYLIKGE